MRADSQDSRHRFRFIKQTDSNGRRWGRENKAENWMRLTRQMSPRIMFINGVYSKWHCALMLTLSWLLMCSLWWPTWEISNALNIHTLLCVWGTFNGLVKDFGVFSVRRCPELIWGRPGRSLGGPMIFRCSQSPKLTGVWKCPISSACRGGVVPRKKESPSQAGCTGRSQAQTWALKASLEHSLSFPISLSLSSPVWPNSNFHRKERAWLSLQSQHASLPFHFPFLTEVYAYPGSTVGPWTFFPLSQKKWSSEKKLQAFVAISTCASTWNGWTAQLCWVGFYYQLDIP